jgi:hypothetical protein
MDKLIREGIAAGLVQVEIVPGAARDWELVITNGSATKATTVTARSAEAAYVWGVNWAAHVAAEAGEAWKLLTGPIPADGEV